MTSPPSTAASAPAPATSAPGAGRSAARARALVVIPAYNEAASLPPVLAELRAECPDVDVLVVSDGSTDDTATVARRSGVIVVELPFNLGIGGALRTGFRYAVENGYRAAVQFDADGQHDPHAVARLLEPVAHGADLVIGSRFADGGKLTYAVGRVRRFAMRNLERVVRRLVGQRFTDTSSGFRAFSRPMLVYFAQHYPVEYMDSVEALVLAANEGFDVCEVPVDMRGRTGGAPSTRGWKLAYYYTRLLVVLLTSYTRPRSRARRAPRPAVSESAAATAPGEGSA